MSRVGSLCADSPIPKRKSRWVFCIGENYLNGDRYDAALIDLAQMHSTYYDVFHALCQNHKSLGGITFSGDTLNFGAIGHGSTCRIAGLQAALQEINFTRDVRLRLGNCKARHDEVVGYLLKGLDRANAFFNQGLKPPLPPQKGQVKTLEEIGRLIERAPASVEVNDHEFRAALAEVKKFIDEIPSSREDNKAALARLAGANNPFKAELCQPKIDINSGDVYVIPITHDKTGTLVQVSAECAQADAIEAYLNRMSFTFYGENTGHDRCPGFKLFKITKEDLVEEVVHNTEARDATGCGQHASTIRLYLLQAASKHAGFTTKTPAPEGFMDRLKEYNSKHEGAGTLRACYHYDNGGGQVCLRFGRISTERFNACLEVFRQHGNFDGTWWRFDLHKLEKVYRGLRGAEGEPKPITGPLANMLWDVLDQMREDGTIMQESLPFMAVPMKKTAPKVTPPEPVAAIKESVWAYLEAVDSAKLEVKVSTNLWELAGDVIRNLASQSGLAVREFAGVNTYEVGNVRVVSGPHVERLQDMAYELQRVLPLMAKKQNREFSQVDHEKLSQTARSFIEMLETEYSEQLEEEPKVIAQQSFGNHNIAIGRENNYNTSVGVGYKMLDACVEDRPGILAEPLKKEEQTMPNLVNNPDGEIYVEGTRIALSEIVEAFNAGNTPEQIQAAYKVLPLSDIYDLRSYTLKNADEVNAYMKRQAEVKAEIEAHATSRKQLLKMKPVGSNKKEVEMQIAAIDKEEKELKLELAEQRKKLSTAEQAELSRMKHQRKLARKRRRHSGGEIAMQTLTLSGIISLIMLCIWRVMRGKPFPKISLDTKGKGVEVEEEEEERAPLALPAPVERQTAEDLLGEEDKVVAEKTAKQPV